ncbi:aminotransferase-like domain-containing protein [Vibrio parahaemolyticus]|uniref:aminotransferase-like domain-containing protein n=1 Tax=Vibrio parahaemolyticus TaxID=670 RepID=UPI0015DFA3E1|nr:PLP-dependent aminotransferase family protein [Vibrio parahaemolyticus]
MGTDFLGSGEGNKYLVVEKKLKQAINGGVYQADDRLPSIRSLSQELNVSKNTVIRAYQELEAQNLVYSVPKSGYRVKIALPTSRSIPDPTRVDLLSICKEILTYPEYQERLPAGSAHPNIDSAAIKSLYAEIGRHSRQQTHVPSHYQLPPGDHLLIKQLAKITQDLGTPAKLDELMVTHGAQQAISLALRATTQKGDIVAVESPCYFGNLLMLESLGLKVVEIPSCPRDGMCPEALAKAMATWDIRAIIVTPNFTNPTGAMMPLEKRQQLLLASGNVPIIEDDVFGGLSYDKPLPSLSLLDDKQRVIYVNSLSKTLDSRLRIGWMLAGRYRDQIEQYLLCENMGSLNLMQSAVATFLTSGKYRTHTARMGWVYQNNMRRFIQMLHQYLDEYESLKNRYQINAVQGSFLLWLRLPEDTDSYALYQACNKHRISLLPGTVFGTQEQYRHCVRISVANFCHETDWSHAMQTLAKLIAKHVC